MSGGHFEYKDRGLMSELFGYDSDRNVKPTRNPYKDWEVSELVYDILNLTHDLDYAESGDSNMEDYRKYLAEFKSKWFVKPRKDRLNEIVDNKIEELRKEMNEMIGDER